MHADGKTVDHHGRTVTCYFLLNHALILVAPMLVNWCLSSLAIFFWIMPTPPYGMPMAPPTLAIFFWIMRCRGFQEVWGLVAVLAIFFWIMPRRASVLASTLPHSLLCLAIFFWIMLTLDGRCYVISFVGDLLFSFELCAYDCGELPPVLFTLALLFSFELCLSSRRQGALEPALQLAIFFWIMHVHRNPRWCIVMRSWKLAIFFWIMLPFQLSTPILSAPLFLLLFSFELCALYTC